MKAVILAGGLGTRLSEETNRIPKPMVEIGGRPILWHIMKIYSHHGVKDFIVCLGYRGYVIKEYFANYALHMSNVTFSMRSGRMTVHQNDAEDWNVTLVDTGAETMTGGRVKRIQPFIEDRSFCLTYGDGLSDVNIKDCIAYHQGHGRIATVTAIVPPGRFGALDLDGDHVRAFAEKPADKNAPINGGFFVLNTEVFDYIKDDTISFENEPLVRLAKDDQLRAYRHSGFWQSMDTLRDKNYLEELWTPGKAPWKLWQ